MRVMDANSFLVIYFTVCKIIMQNYRFYHAACNILFK
jgi:hypothetical protein